jgi:hypothetical protein
VFGYATEVRAHQVEAQLESAVDLFLRGYGTQGRGTHGRGGR